MKNEWCVYRCVSDTRCTIFALHVNDIIAASSSVAEPNCFKVDLLSKWEISDLGPAKFMLGISISRDISNHTISICQGVFIDRLIERFNQMDVHPCDTPMIAGLQLTRDEKGKPVPPPIIEWMEHTPYRELVGSLNYLAIATRPDISFAVGILASFLDCYRDEHWNAAIRVLRYVKGTRDLSLTFIGSSPLTLVIYYAPVLAPLHSPSHSISCPSHS